MTVGTDHSSESRDKKFLRRTVLERRRAVPQMMLMAMSDEINARVMSLPEYSLCRVVAAYVALPDEVQTERLIRTALSQGKEIIVPTTLRTDGSPLFSRLMDFEKELEKKPSGILEPKREFLRPFPLDRADLILVPMVAWDERGYRLGYGRGYFDIALSEIGEPRITVGLALEAQRVNRVPNEPHDVRLKVIVTEKRILRIKLMN